MVSYLDNLFDKEEIDMFLVEEISKYGYPEDFIFNSLENNEINYATASYYILKKQLIVNKKHPLAVEKQINSEIKF